VICALPLDSGQITGNPEIIQLGKVCRTLVQNHGIF
jgi:hypothetical protein